MRLRNGARYIGEIKQWKFDGFGEYTMADGKKFIGEFKDGNYLGKVWLKKDNGDYK